MFCCHFLFKLLLLTLTFVYSRRLIASLCSRWSSSQARCSCCVIWGLSPNYHESFLSIDPGVRQVTSHGFGLFMRRRSNFFPAPFPTRPSFLLCHAAMCLCIPYRLDKRMERSYSLLPLTFASCFYNLCKACCLHSGTGFVLKKRDNGERHNVIS